jgi:glutamyl-Q tRNA(Asp) synthetase
MRSTRFAPSTTGSPHLGTLLSAVFTYLHARSQDMAVRLRLEDLDPDRCKETYAVQMQQILELFGFDWDGVDVQSRNLEHYEESLHRLAQRGRVYRCGCSRARLKALGRTAADGSHIYDGHCQAQSWRPGDPHDDATLRAKLDGSESRFLDLRFGEQIHHVSRDFGDPVIVRRDGAFSYHFSSVIDDHRVGITDVVRGRDLLFSSPVQVALRNLFQMRVPVYLHHPLLMERRKQKLAKLHGSLPVKDVLERYSPQEILGYFAYWFGLSEDQAPRSLSSLVSDFNWDLVPFHDVQVEFSEDGLQGQALKE